MTKHDIAFSNNVLHQVHQHIMHWYAAHGRTNLPWRNIKDPYAIYISEVMLQQTQVATVLDRYYYPFLEEFPTLQALARASQDDVLKAWEGLGYYSRARNLHKAAQIVFQEGLPTDIDALQRLPGIGKNTAHAIAAFAFQQPVPVMEANVRRVLHRIFAWETANDKQLWEAAYHMVDTHNAFDYNQAMMDIGSLICVKSSPKCKYCPLNSICKGKKEPTQYPRAKNKQKKPVRKKNIVVFSTKDGYFAVKKRETRFLNGLFQFIELNESSAKIDFGGKTYYFKEHHCIGLVEQQYSHFTLDGTVYHFDLVEPHTSNEIEWVHKEILSALAFSKAEHKVLALLQRV